MRLILIAAIVLSSGCDGPLGSAHGPVGTWDLVSADGQPLPFAHEDYQLVDGTITLRADGTFTAGFTLRTDDATGELSEPFESNSSGSWERDGSTVRLAENIVGTFTATTLTVDWLQLVTYEYQRR